MRDPLVRKTLEGIRRAHGQPKRKAKALRLEHIAQMVNHLRHLPDSKKKNRDIALILTSIFLALFAVANSLQLKSATSRGNQKVLSFSYPDPKPISKQQGWHVRYLLVPPAAVPPRPLRIGWKWLVLTMAPSSDRSTGGNRCNQNRLP